MPHPPNAAGVALDKIASVTPPLPPGVTVGGEPRAAVVPSAPSAPSPVEEEDLTALGIDTLWRVTLTSQNAEVAASATQDLLEVRERATAVMLSPLCACSFVSKAPCQLSRCCCYCFGSMTDRARLTLPHATSGGDRSTTLPRCSGGPAPPLPTP